MRNKKFIIFSLVLLVGIFSIGYVIANYFFYSKDRIINSKNNSNDNVSVSSEKDVLLSQIIEENVEVVFKVQCGDSSTFRIERSSSASKLEVSQKSLKELYEKFRVYGYKIKDVDNDKIELCRKSNIYDPNKYIILLENCNLIICKSDNEGNIYNKKGEYIYKEELGDTGINITINSLQEGDIKKIITGDKDMQLDTLEDAFTRLADYI
ncbi:hypothetical protein [Clostridium grantii]|uniref:Uncharacterized protein n=1 Tax=Clostridium grantii DSM 8605 TaxID=1121316 RepID=A0A1M5SKG4_9CLOT|nr:hypothetical protein [Clostridium grantii]SHH38955.1 hypothetical protein SAMN02745207_00985 [Clostridium grantii DSM 8605]